MWDELLTFGKDEAALDSRMIQNIIQKIVVSAHVVEEMLWYLRAAHINRTYRQPKNVFSTYILLLTTVRTLKATKEDIEMLPYCILSL